MNRLFITGNLTRDPESRSTQDGKTVCNFTVAVNRRQRNAQGQNEADFFRVAVWGSMAPACQQYLAKGRKVAVVGPVSVRTYTGQDGVTRAQLEVIAQDVEFLSSRSEAAEKSDSMIGQAERAFNAPASDPAIQQGFTPVETDDLPF